MKLKKIASLMLAGVMAISMLAGCSNGGNTDEDKTETNDLSAAVVAALSENTTKYVTFTANDDLADAITVLKAKYGTEGLANNFTIDNLNKVNSAYTTANSLSSVSINTNGATADQIEAAMKADTATYAVKQSQIANFPVGANEATVAKAIAKRIDSDIASAASALPAQTGVYTVNANGNQAAYSGRVNFTYTGTVSVYGDTNTETGIVTYYLVYTITRTGTEAKI